MVGKSAALISGRVCLLKKKSVMDARSAKRVKSRTIKIENSDTLQKYKTEIKNTVRLTWFAVFCSGFSLRPNIFLISDMKHLEKHTHKY